MQKQYTLNDVAISLQVSSAALYRIADTYRRLGRCLAAKRIQEAAAHKAALSRVAALRYTT